MIHSIHTYLHDECPVLDFSGEPEFSDLLHQTGVNFADGGVGAAVGRHPLGLLCLVGVGLGEVLGLCVLPGIFVLLDGKWNQLNQNIQLSGKWGELSLI